MPGWDISDDSELCENARTLAEDAWLNGAQWTQIVFGTLTVILCVIVLAKKKISSMAMHRNLKVTMDAWYQVTFRTFADPCDLLIPSWITVFVRGPITLYMLGFPLWHMAVAFERAWATFLVKTYESATTSYGIFCSVVVWLSALAYTFYVFYLATLDQHFYAKSYYTVLTKGSNSNFLIDSTYVLVGIDTCTCLADCILLHVNRKNMRKIGQDYTLSRSYQTYENVGVTTGLILPLNLCSIVHNLVYMSACIWVRSVRKQLLPHQYYSICEWLFVIVLVQMVVSLHIFLYIGRCEKKRVTIVAHRDESDLYFRNFRKQIGSKTVPLHARNSIYET